jgi:hypothetical protein
MGGIALPQGREVSTITGKTAAEQGKIPCREKSSSNNTLTLTAQGEAGIRTRKPLTSCAGKTKENFVCPQGEAATAGPVVNE